jgi:hypothetical protein
MTVGAFYAGKELPPKIKKHLDNQVLCPKRGTMFAQKNLNQIFIVPIK